MAVEQIFETEAYKASYVQKFGKPHDAPKVTLVLHKLSITGQILDTLYLEKNVARGVYVAVIFIMETWQKKKLRDQRLNTLSRALFQEFMD